MTTIGNMSPDEVTVANIYDEIVLAGTFVAFDDLGKVLQKRKSDV
jgi:hypothetical protein